jgi:hypothetical protein
MYLATYMPTLARRIMPLGSNARVRAFKSGDTGYGAVQRVKILPLLLGGGHQAPDIHVPLNGGSAASDVTAPSSSKSARDKAASSSSKKQSTKVA